MNIFSIMNTIISKIKNFFTESFTKPDLPELSASSAAAMWPVIRVDMGIMGQ